MTTADEKKWSLESVRGKFILTCVVKTVVVKHVEGNMSREIWRGEYGQAKYIYCIFFVIVTAIVQPRTPLLQLKPPGAFQTVHNNEELCLFFPLKKPKETKKSEK